MAEFGRDYEILVLDDASTDCTREVLEGYRSRLPLRILRNDESVGESAGLESLLREAVISTKYPKRDSAVTLRSDFSDSPDAIVPLVRALEGGSDIVAGTLKTEKVKSSFLVSIARFLMEVLLGKVFYSAPVSDPLCGLRAYRLIVLKKAFNASSKRPLVASRGWLANLELLSVLAPHARRVSEMAIDSSCQSGFYSSRFSAVGTLSNIRRVRQEVVWEN